MQSTLVATVRTSLSRPVVRALWSDKLTVASALFMALVVVAALAGPLLSPYEGWRQNLSQSLVAPLSSRDGQFHVFGTDSLGRDILTRLMEGGRVSLAIGGSVVVVSGLMGVALGVLAGFYRGWVDDLIMRVVDMFMAVPTLFFLLIVLYVVGAGTVNMVLVLAIARWMLYCRIARGLVLSLREQSFVSAAYALGATDARIMRWHIVPNVLTPLLTVATMDVARVILIESSLSFLGLGIQPPNTSWGVMVADGRRYISSAWWLSTMPGITIFLTTLSVNLFGAWLRAINDPIQRWRWLASPAESRRM